MAVALIASRRNLVQRDVGLSMRVHVGNGRRSDAGLADLAAVHGMVGSKPICVGGRGYG